MVPESALIDVFKYLISFRLPISISGESGTGKTTLALYLVGNLLTSEENYRGSCIWIQAGENFPIKRLNQMFESQFEKLQYIKENILVSPQDHIINTYEEQNNILRKIISSSTVLPPDLRYIVIDNISHHLRYKLTYFNSISAITKLLDTFYEDQLQPLILFCRRANIGLLLIHEVTFDPNSSLQRPFFYKLYDRLGTIDIVLSKSYNSIEKKMMLTTSDFTKNFTYILDQKGLCIH